MRAVAGGGPGVSQRRDELRLDAPSFDDELPPAQAFEFLAHEAAARDPKARDELGRIPFDADTNLIQYFLDHADELLRSIAPRSSLPTSGSSPRRRATTATCGRRCSIRRASGARSSTCDDRRAGAARSLDVLVDVALVLLEVLANAWFRESLATK